MRKGDLMNKRRTIPGALGLSALLLFTGCADKGTLGQLTADEDHSNDDPVQTEISAADTEVELLSIKTVRESFDEEADKIRTREFDNINFENAYFSFPQTDEVHTLEYRITDFDISPDDAYDSMCKKLDELFPEMFSDEEKANEIRFLDVIVNFNEEEQRYEEYPTLEQYKTLEEKNYPYLLTNHPSTGINNESDHLLNVLNGVLWAYDNGSLAMQSEFHRGLGSFDVLNEYPVAYRTENLESEQIFHLASGDISIADAVKSAEKQLSAWVLSERELPLKLSIQNVNVLDVGNQCYAFYFGVVPEYKNMKYNCMLPDTTVFGFGTIGDTTNECEACGEAIMCEADQVCRYRMFHPASVYDIAERGSSASVIPLKNAAEITSEYLTQGIRFKALSVSAVYKSFSESKYKQSIDYESYEKREITIRPCWRFVLEPLTGSTDRLYYIFVDMLTGQAYSTVQQMGSDMKYD